LRIGTNDAPAYQTLIVHGPKRETVQGNRVVYVGEQSHEEVKDTYYVKCARMGLDVNQDDYEINVQRHSRHKVKTGDYTVDAERGGIRLSGDNISQFSFGTADILCKKGLCLSSDSEIILQAGESQIILNSTGVFIDGPTVVLNGGTPLAGYQG